MNKPTEDVLDEMDRRRARAEARLEGKLLPAERDKAEEDLHKNNRRGIVRFNQIEKIPESRVDPRSCDAKFVDYFGGKKIPDLL